MKTNPPRVQEPESRPGCVSAAIPARGTIEAELEALKQRLLHSMGEVEPCPALAKVLAGAANEAAALAWYTSYPFLLLPGLLEEKLQGTLRWWERQQQLREAVSLPLAA